MNVFVQLHREGLLSDPSFDRIQTTERSRFFTVFWETRLLMYLGVLLFTTGTGILIYKNIDTIGHQVILVLIGLICIGSFYYCETRKQPLSKFKVAAPNGYFDYVLLLGCLTLITFITYLQAQYFAFGDAFGLASFIPMIILFFCAYYFDHLGVLSLAITNLAAWMGIVVTPLKVLKDNDFNDSQIIVAGLVLGVFLVAASEFSNRKNFKKHFSFTYLNFGMNILFIATLAGMFHFNNYYVAWLAPLALISYIFYRKAVNLNSFYIALMVTIYAYIGLSYVFVRLVDEYMLALLYFIGSGIGTIVLLVSLNRKLKKA